MNHADLNLYEMIVALSLLQQSIGIAIFLFIWWMKYRVLVRAGFNGWWLSLVWSIPIVCWFFKLWFAFTPWPAGKGTKRKKAAPARKRSRKRAAA